MEIFLDLRLDAEGPEMAQQVGDGAVAVAGGALREVDRQVDPGELPAGVTAKDLMLFILLNYAKPQRTLNRVMEFGGPGLASLSMPQVEYM